MASFLAAVGLGIAGMWIEPPGEVSGSACLLIAQFMVLSATYLGLHIKFDLTKKMFDSTESDKKKDKEEE